MFRDIERSNGWVDIEPIEKGWSTDEKFKVTCRDQSIYLLRISPLESFETKKREFEFLSRVKAFDLKMTLPIAIGLCDNGQSCYLLFTWLEGVDASSVIEYLPEETQYAHGISAGEALRKIHSIEAPQTQEDWKSRFNRKMDHKIAMYHACPIKVDGAEHMLRYIEANRTLLEERPQSLHHGDFHIGNMIITPSGQLGIIDFNRMDFGDPWEDFNRITWCAMASPKFATGLIDGYFEQDVPELFFKLMALYISSNQLSSIPWAIPFGQSEVDVMINQTKLVLQWYDNMNCVIPTWYLTK